jgi:hypothetical protein
MRLATSAGPAAIAVERARRLLEQLATGQPRDTEQPSSKP